MMACYYSTIKKLKMLNTFHLSMHLKQYFVNNFILFLCFTLTLLTGLSAVRSTFPVAMGGMMKSDLVRFDFSLGNLFITYGDETEFSVSGTECRGKERKDLT